MRIECFILGEMQTNCYLVRNEETNEAVMIDPGTCPKELVQHIKDEEIKLDAILLTHGHFDHIGGIDGFVDEFQVPVYAGEKEQALLLDPNLSLTSDYVPGGYIFADAISLTDGQILHLAGYDFEVIFTPGHTVGSVSYYVASEGVLFDGDCLFYESVGRTDFPTGDTEALLDSIQNRLFALPDQTKVYPGHMDITTIGFEKTHNPYLRGGL